MSRSSRAPASVPTDTTFGLWRRTCSAARATFDPAARATTSNRPGSESTTFKHCVPIEPVDPRIEMCFMWQRFYRGLRDFANSKRGGVFTIGTRGLDITDKSMVRAVYNLVVAARVRLPGDAFWGVFLNKSGDD